MKTKLNYDQLSDELLRLAGGPENLKKVGSSLKSVGKKGQKA